MTADKHRSPGDRATIKVQWIKRYFLSAPFDEDDAAAIDPSFISKWARRVARTDARRERRIDDREELRARLQRR